jgi:predicted Zn-dependent protease
LARFHQALELDPDSRAARLGLGTAHIQNMRYAEAIEVMEPLCEEYPEDYVTKNNLAWLYATASDKQFRNGEEAVRLAQEALFLAPGNLHVWSTLAEAHYVSGNYERAAKAAAECMRLALERRLDESRLLEFSRQLKKCREAASAFSVAE